MKPKKPTPWHLLKLPKSVSKPRYSGQPKQPWILEPELKDKVQQFINEARAIIRNGRREICRSKALLKVLAILLFFLSSCSPTLTNTGPVQYQPTKSEVRQRNFVILWTLAGVAVIGFAIDQAHEDDKPRK